MSKVRRVAVNASIIGEQPTGLGLYSVNLIRELDRIRDDLVVFTSCPRALGAVRAAVARVPAAVRPERGLRGHLMRLLWLQGLFRARLRGSEVVLHTVPEAVLGCPIPQVTVVHDVLPLLFPADFPRQHHYYRVLVPRLLRSSRIVVAVSATTRRDIVDAYGLPAEKVRVVHNGYDPTAYELNGQPALARAPGAPYFLFVGNLMPHKNLLRVLDALAILRRRVPCRLVVRGDGRRAYARALRARIEALGLGDAVAFERYVDEGAMRELYGGAVSLVIPSLYEGFGLPILEAMACGTPVITSNVSSLAEVAGPAALMVDPRAADELAEAMYRVLTEADLREDLRRRGLERVGAFSWRRTAEQMSDVLDEALSAAPSGARRSGA